MQKDLQTLVFLDSQRLGGRRWGRRENSPFFLNPTLSTTANGGLPGTSATQQYMEIRYAEKYHLSASGKWDQIGSKSVSVVLTLKMLSGNLTFLPQQR